VVGEEGVVGFLVAGVTEGLVVGELACWVSKLVKDTLPPVPVEEEGM
jgi:hypothetical protein